MIFPTEQKLIDAITPDAIEAGPVPGEWRQKWLAKHQDNHLFWHILVALDGQQEGWIALDLGIIFAQHESGKFYGLHVIVEKVDQNSIHLREIQRIFEQRCQLAGICGELRIESGRIAREICDNSRWMHLVIDTLKHPPRPQPLDRLGSGFSQ